VVACLLRSPGQATRRDMTGALDRGHFVQFFDADDELVRGVVRFHLAGFEAGETVICVATPEHREKIDAQLVELGADPGALAASYRYIPLDARTTLDSFMDGQRLDRERFHRNIGLLIAQAASRGAPVRIFGEMVVLLAQQGRDPFVLELEELWNELSRYHSFSLFCAYPRASCSRAMYETICAVHSHVHAF
jgi:hypothetical protein